MEVYILMCHQHIASANWEEDEGITQGEYICGGWKTLEKAEQELERRADFLCKTQGGRREGGRVRYKFADGIDKIVIYYIKQVYIND